MENAKVAQLLDFPDSDGEVTGIYKYLLQFLCQIIWLNQCFDQKTCHTTKEENTCTKMNMCSEFDVQLLAILFLVMAMKKGLDGERMNTCVFGYF